MIRRQSVSINCIFTSSHGNLGPQGKSLNWGKSIRVLLYLILLLFPLPDAVGNTMAFLWSGVIQARAYLSYLLISPLAPLITYVPSSPCRPYTEPMGHHVAGEGFPLSSSSSTGISGPSASRNRKRRCCGPAGGFWVLLTYVFCGNFPLRTVL